MPLLPNLRNLKGKGRPRRCAAPSCSVIGIGLPANFASDGFGSNVSTCDGAAVHEQVDDALGFRRETEVYGEPWDRGRPFRQRVVA